MSKKSPFCWLFCSFLEPLPSLIFELTSSLTHRAAALAPSAAISCSVIPSFLLHPLSILTSQTFSVMIRIPYMVVTQLCPTLCDPMDCIACQATLSMGFSRQEYWSGLSFPSVNQTSSGDPTRSVISEEGVQQSPIVLLEPSSRTAGNLLSFAHPQVAKAS